MFCPKCGTENNDELKFCRNCGENLKIISQAMTKRLPVYLASKMDAYLESKNERIRRDSIINACIGVGAIALGVYYFVTGGGGIFTGAWYPILFGILAIIWSIWDYAVYKRSLSLNRNAEENNETEKLSVFSSSKELPPRETSRKLETPSSIVETTTKHLDPVKRQ